MSDDLDATRGPAEAGAVERAQQAQAPSPEREGRVEREQRRRRPVAPAGSAPAGSRGDGLRFWWRLSLAAAAALMLVAIGFRWGRGVGRPAAGAGGSAAYALLLYETESYEVAEGATQLALYHENSRWVAAARARKQYVTGEDFDTAEGWTLAPAGEAAAIAPGAAAPATAVLSGVFLVTGEDRDVLALAEELPHLRRGGHVVVQKVIATDAPPAGD